MTRYLRLNALLDLIAERGSVDIESAAGELGVSAATIRRDLDHLATQQLVTRTRGGALANAVANDLPLQYKTTRQAAEKMQIGRAAAKLVSSGMVVSLNGGTTTTEAARAIAASAENTTDEGPSVTIVTNALNIANELIASPHIKMVALGGVARPQSYELTGPLTTLILNVLTIDLLLLGVDALDATFGASAHHEGEASINKLMVDRAARVVALVDSSKLGKRAFAQICPTDQISTVITDSAADPDLVRALESRGVKVVIA